MIGFSIPRTFTLRSILPTTVILHGAEGEVAESIFQQITPSLRERGDRRIRWLWAEEEHFPQKPLIALTGTERQGEGFFRFLKRRFCNSRQALRAE